MAEILEFRSRRANAVVVDERCDAGHDGELARLLVRCRKLVANSILCQSRLNELHAELEIACHANRSLGDANVLVIRDMIKMSRDAVSRLNLTLQRETQELSELCVEIATSDGDR